MPSIPMCRPDGPMIRDLIEKRGYSVAEFSRLIGAPKSVRTIWRAIGSRPVGIWLVRRMADGLRVRPGDISDWKNDDEDWDRPVRQIPALGAQ